MDDELKWYRFSRSHIEGNEQINNFIKSIFVNEKSTSEEQITEKYIKKLIGKINICLNMPNDDLFSALFFDDEKYVQKRFLTKIQQTADLLWNGWMKRDFTYKDYELQFLRDTYQLNTKLIYSNQISPRQKQERHYVLKYTSPLSEFTDILLDSIYLKTLQAVLAVVNAFIVSSSAYSGLLELTMWLDTYTYFNKRFPSEHGYLKCQIDIIRPCILDEKYKRYLSQYNSNEDVDAIQRFYVGACSLFYSLLDRYTKYEKCGLWIALVEPLLFYLQHFIIESALFTEVWTDGHLYCALGVIALITSYYCVAKENREHLPLHPSVFRRYKLFYDMLLKVLKQERFQKQILSTGTNNETRLIDLILKYIFTVLNIYDDIKYLLRSLDASVIVVKFLETKHAQININSLYIFTIICEDDDIRKLNIAEELTSTYLQLTEDLTSAYWKLNKDADEHSWYRSFLKHHLALSETRLNKHLDYFLLLSKKTSIQGTIAFRNGLKYFVEYKEKKELKQITEILWTLSFHPLIQKQFRKDESLLASLRKCSKEKGDIRSTILWTLGDHTGLANTELKRSEHENTGYTVYSNIQKWEDLVPYKVILDHTSDDNKICKNIANHLCLYGFRTFRQLSISLLQSNSLDSMKSIIVCLSEYYEQCNISRAILQYSTKKQFNIIPIIIQKTYKPQGWVKEVLNKTHIMDFTQLPFIDSLNMLIDVIKSMESKVETSSVETVTNDTVQTEDVSLDLFTICRRNNVTKLRKYVGKMTIDQINRIGPNGETALHVATNHGHKEIIQLLLDNEASRSIRNQITNRAAYEENLTLEIKQLFQRPKHENRFLANSSLEVFEWTLHYNDPVLQRSQFRRRLINPFKVDRNIVRSTLNKDQLSSIFRVTLANFSDNFLSTLSSNEIAARHKSFIEWFFQQAIMKVDSTFILKAYTSATNFYGILNKTLAKFALEYFDAILQESTDYKALISTIDLISLLINDADLDKHNYRGTTYRGMLLRNEDLVKYVVGSKLMNISFVSTSKDREIAEIFAGQNSESTLSEIPAVCIYTIRNMGTALDVEEISEIPDEREVLVLPFSAFQIRCIRRLDKTVNKGIMVELELEECDEYQGENNSSKRQRLLLMSLLEQSDMNLII